MNYAIPALAAAVLLCASNGWAETERQLHEHQHGHGELQLVLDKDQLFVQLHSPLDNLVGFEHAPANDTERQAVVSMKETLADADKLFDFGKDSHCLLQEHEITVPETFMNHGEQDDDADHDHAELEALWQFKCKKAPNKLTVPMLSSFSRFQELDVQFLTENGAVAVELDSAEQEVTLP
ncbi:MAG: DUF2796 domain-containing protein [Reinekea sp.]|jgi:hypothetical protein